MNRPTPLHTRLRSACACVAATLCLALSNGAHADTSLEEQRIRELLIRGLPAHSYQPKITLQNAGNGQTACDDPKPFLQHPDQRGFGRVMVGVRCAGTGQSVHYVQASVAVMGTYVVNRVKIAPGQVIEADMLAMRNGPLERLPAKAVLNPKDVIGLRANHAFSPSSPLTLSAFRKAWVVEQNHQVALQVQGDGFMLSREGKALDNGYLGDEVRVMSGRNKVLRAKVIGPDRLLVRY